MVGREELARTAEAGGDLVEDQQHTVRVARLAEHPQIRGGVEAHPARALDHRLHDHRRQLVRMTADQLMEVVGVPLLVLCGRRVGEDLPRQHPDQRSCMPPSGSHTDMGCQVSPW